MHPEVCLCRGLCVSFVMAVDRGESWCATTVNLVGKECERMFVRVFSDR